MQKGRKCIFVILQEKQLCAQISCVFHCFLASYFFNKNVNILSWDLFYRSKWVILHELSIAAKKLNFTQNVTYDLFAFTRRNLLMMRSRREPDMCTIGRNHVQSITQNTWKKYCPKCSFATLASVLELHVELSSNAGRQCCKLCTYSLKVTSSDIFISPPQKMLQFNKY